VFRRVRDEIREAMAKFAEKNRSAGERLAAARRF
jgi:hypothetical protein